MKYLLMIAAALILAGCGDDGGNDEVVVVGNEDGPEEDQYESEENEEQNDADEHVEAEGEEAPAEEDDGLISDMEPNDVAELVNEHNFEIVSEEDRNDYERVQDIDGDGNDETVQILDNTLVEDDGMQLGHYILAIFDGEGVARYAEYTYNFIGGHAEPEIMDVVDLDDDGISEIIMENVMASTATSAAGLQSPTRFIYKYDESLGQFTNVPSLGRFLKNEAVDNYDININDVITGLDYDFSYESAIEDPENEALLGDFVDYRIIDESMDGFSADFVENTHGHHRYQHPSDLQKLEGPDIGVVYNDPVYPARWLTLNATALYAFNPDYNWLEIVGMDGEFDQEADVSEERQPFTISDFNGKFDTDSASINDYFGDWTMVVDGRVQDFNQVTINIDEDEITETHSENGDVAGHNNEVDIDTMTLDDMTGQLKVTGEVTENDATDVNNAYDNIFTIMYIEGTQHMMDKYGNFYLQLD